MKTTTISTAIRTLGFLPQFRGFDHAEAVAANPTRRSDAARQTKSDL
ncbi:MAG: hypothetical protein WBV55_07430 [Candidatus Sulfotelmatobacter sp.]